MDIDELRRRIATMRQSMLVEGILDRVFVQLERDEEKDTPNFVELIFEFYFEGSAEMIPAIEQELEAEAPDLDYVKLDEALFRFKGSSASVGANIVVTEIKKALRCCMKHDVEGCRAAVGRMKEAHSNLTSRLQAYFEVIQQARLAEASNPPK